MKNGRMEKIKIAIVALALVMALAVFTPVSAASDDGLPQTRSFTAGSEEETWLAIFDPTTGDIVHLIGIGEGNVEKFISWYERMGLIVVIITDHPLKNEILNDPWRFYLEENTIKKKTPEQLRPEEVGIVMTKEASVECWIDNRPVFKSVLCLDPELGYVHVFMENSTMSEVKLRIKEKQLTVNFRGELGTTGACSILMSSELIHPSELRVHLDNKPWEFQISNVSFWTTMIPPSAGPYYYVSVAYTHSTHTLMLSSISWYEQPLNLALIASAVMIAIGAIYWFKFRR